MVRWIAALLFAVVLSTTAATAFADEDCHHEHHCHHEHDSHGHHG